jgi:hypothetical protein
VVNGSRTSAEAPLKIWSWDGQNIMLKEDRKWPGGIRCIYVVDADGDGVNDVFTGGTVINETGSYSSLRFWHWGDEELSLKAFTKGSQLVQFSLATWTMMANRKLLLLEACRETLNILVSCACGI